MARWRLINPHYLNIPGGEWDYRETDRETGKQARRVFAVPTYLDPKAQSDCNYPGEIIVGNKPHDRDILYMGPPTPDMRPLDEEAEAISAKYRPLWNNPIESLPSNGPSQSVIPSIDVVAFQEMQRQMTVLMQQNADLQARLADQPARRA